MVNGVEQPPLTCFAPPGIALDIILKTDTTPENAHFSTDPYGTERWRASYGTLNIRFTLVDESKVVASLNNLHGQSLSDIATKSAAIIR
jgi:hypothetical protein